jgi:hypothetical protein
MELCPEMRSEATIPATSPQIFLLREAAIVIERAEILAQLGCLIARMECEHLGIAGATRNCFSSNFEM